jgi:hypothetical protein
MWRDEGPDLMHQFEGVTAGQLVRITATRAPLPVDRQYSVTGSASNSPGKQVSLRLINSTTSIQLIADSSEAFEAEHTFPEHTLTDMFPPVDLQLATSAVTVNVYGKVYQVENPSHEKRPIKVTDIPSMMC